MTEAFAALLKPLIDRSGKSQKTITEEIGAAGGYVTHLLSGKINPGPEKATRLIEALGVPPEMQVRFLLEAAGYDEEAIRDALIAAGDTAILQEGDRIVLSKGPMGWKITNE